MTALRTGDIDRFHDGHLSGESVTGHDPQSLLEAEYDYVLTGTSWDRRCLVITGCGIHAHWIQIFRPQNVGKGDLRREHDAAIASWAETAGDNLDWVDQPSEDLADGFKRVADGLLTARRKAGRPLRILVDLSASARYFTLAAVALALNDGVGEFVDVLYADGEYGDVISESRTEIGDEELSSWETFAIPSLEGDWYPTRQRHFLISAGFSGDQAARIAERADPDVVTVLMPKPGLRPEYEQRAVDSNRRWMKRYGVEQDRVVNAPSSDAIATWRAVAASRQVNPYSENVFCLLTGTKPHALALSVWSMARENPAVLYVRPTSHQESDIKPSGTYWRYRFWDRSSLPAQSAEA